MYFNEMGLERVDCIYLAKNMHKWQAFANIVMNLLFPQNVGKFLTS
jgi:hypothetical protein